MYLDSRFETYEEQREFFVAARVRCDNSLLYFTRFFFKEITGNKFIVNWHHEEICKELKRVESYELELLNINIPPRFSKTELAAVNFIARGIGMNPTGNYLYITASDELRSQTSISIRDIVTHPFFKMMYGIELKKDQNGKNLWRTKQGGGLKTATIFGQITGFGAGIMNDVIEDIRTFEGCIVMDDINKLDDSQVENANNEKVSRTVFNTVLSRKNSKDTPIINIQQRAGLSDITAEFEEHYGDSEDRIKFMVMPVISEEGKPLWEWKHGLKEIEKLKTSPKTAHVFETQYMQNPLPSEGVLFVRSEMNWFNPSELKTEYIESKIGNIDVAGSGKDYYSFPSGCLIGEMFYVTDWLYTQKDTDYTRPATAGIANTNKINHLGIESNNMGWEFAKRLKTELNNFTTIYPKPETTNKVSRIINRSEFIRKHFVFRSDVKEGSDYDKALKHLFRFQKDGGFKIDDAPDSLTGLAQLIQELGFPQFT